jgi:hypothetical protein
LTPDREAPILPSDFELLATMRTYNFYTFSPWKFLMFRIRVKVLYFFKLV